MLSDRERAEVCVKIVKTMLHGNTAPRKTIDAALVHMLYEAHHVCFDIDPAFVLTAECMQCEFSLEVAVD